MPYSDEHRVIFLHVPKTGGSFIKKRFGITSLDDPGPGQAQSPQHLTCAALRQEIGEEKYEQYYKFAFVRNPWARLVSDYFWRQQLARKRSLPPFGEFVRHAAEVVRQGTFHEEEFGDHFIPQTEYTRDVDDVFRFERFADGVRAVATRLGLEVGALPPKPAKPHDDYRHYYDRRSRAQVMETYHDEIERFAYAFDDAAKA